MYFANQDGMNVHHATIISKIEDDEIYYAAHSSPRQYEPLSPHLLREENGKWVGEMVVIVKLRDDA